MYFLDSNSASLNEMNISSQNIKREVSLEQRNPYLSMIIVDSSLQARGELQTSKNCGKMTTFRHDSG